MTEQEWLKCADPQLMLVFLQSKATDRKLRLFAVGCCQSVRAYLWTQSSDRAIQVAEQYADQFAKLEELEAAQTRIVKSLELYGDEPIYDASYWACWREAEEAAATCAWYARNNSTRQVEWAGPDGEARCLEVAAKEEAKQADLLREIFGNPFCPVALDPAWQTNNVVVLAHAIYEQRAFDRMPILGDALEDAGCTNADILNHCRQPGEHVPLAGGYNPGKTVIRQPMWEAGDRRDLRGARLRPPESAEL